MNSDNEYTLRMSISKLGFLVDTINQMTSPGNPYTCEFLETIGGTRALAYIIDDTRNALVKVYARLFPDMEDEEEMGLDLAREELAAKESKPAAGLDEGHGAFEVGCEGAEVDEVYLRGCERLSMLIKEFVPQLGAEA